LRSLRASRCPEYKTRAAPPLAIYLESRHGGVLACPVVDSAPPLDPADWRAPTEVRERRRVPRDREVLLRMLTSRILLASTTAALNSGITDPNSIRPVVDRATSALESTFFVTLSRTRGALRFAILDTPGAGLGVATCRRGKLFRGARAGGDRRADRSLVGGQRRRRVRPQLHLPHVKKTKENRWIRDDGLR
jgi:hypothetical protein